MPTLLYAVADRTGIPTEEQRLIFGGRQLGVEGKLEEFGVFEGATIGLALR